MYIGFLMFGTILSPGTIFLMVISAMDTVMGLESQTSLMINLVPLLIFSYVCIKAQDNNTKVNLAMALSVIYCLLMLAVLVGTGELNYIVNKIDRVLSFVCIQASTFTSKEFWHRTHSSSVP